MYTLSPVQLENMPRPNVFLYLHPHELLCYSETSHDDRVLRGDTHILHVLLLGRVKYLYSLACLRLYVLTIYFGIPYYYSVKIKDFYHKYFRFFSYLKKKLQNLYEFKINFLLIKVEGVVIHYNLHYKYATVGIRYNNVLIFKSKCTL